MDQEKTETSFEDLKLNRQLLNALEEAGFERPTPIQEKAIPAVLSGQDLFGIAQTGTGKTAAFLLPILMKLKFASGDHPRALILSPTRELAMQIAKHFEILGKYTDLRSVCVFGGIGITKQIAEIEKGVDVLIATPGRLFELYFREVLFLRQVKFLVLDEADRLTDMGFMPQLRRLLEILPRKRQNLLFSATLPEKVVTLSEEFLEYPLRIEVTPQATAAETIRQSVCFVPNFRTKLNLLLHLLQDTERFRRLIVFTKTKNSASGIGKFLERKILEDVRIIHANKGQNTRINAMNAFREGDVRVLVATDVSARGIDVEDVSQVINFDVPGRHDDYVHRIGRTGRATKIGEAITFCTEPDRWHLAKIEALIRMNIETFELPAEVEITETPKEERQEMLRSIDQHKRRDDPEFKGAFHDKKFQAAEKKKKAPGKKGPKVWNAKTKKKR